MTDTTYRVAVIPGDGIGREVVPVAQEALEAVGERCGFRWDWTVFGWSCELYARTGSMTGEEASRRCRMVRAKPTVPARLSFSIASARLNSSRT